MHITMTFVFLDTRSRDILGMYPCGLKTNVCQGIRFRDSRFVCSVREIVSKMSGFLRRGLIMPMNCFWDRMLCDGVLDLKGELLVVLTEGLLLVCIFGNPSRFKRTARSPETGTKSVHWARFIISALPANEVEKQKM